MDGLETRTSRALGILFYFIFPLFYQRVFTDKRFRLLNTTATSPIRLHDLPSRLNDNSSIVDDNTTAPFDSTATAAASTAPFDSMTTAAASTAAVSNGCWTKDGRTDGWARRRQRFFFFLRKSFCFVLSLFSLTNGQQQRRQQQCQTDAGQRMDGQTAGLVAGNIFFFFSS